MQKTVHSQSARNSLEPSAAKLRQPSGSGRLAQLAALINQSPRVQAQRQLVAEVNAGSPAAAQLEEADASKTKRLPQPHGDQDHTRQPDPQRRDARYLQSPEPQSGRLAQPANRQTVAQRVLDGDEKEGEKIKIWEDDGVVEVYLGREWAMDDACVFFFRKKPTKKKPGQKPEKPEKIAANLAFSIGMPNAEIKAEVAQTGEAEDALENSQWGSLRVPADVLEYLLELVREHAEEYGLEVPPNLVRIRLMISSLESLAIMFTEPNPSNLKELKEMIEGDTGYYLDEIMAIMGTTGAQTPGSSQQGGSSSGGHEEWKTTRTEKLKGALLSRIQSNPLAKIVSEESTLHHKLSRARFKRMMQLLGETPGNQSGVNEMLKFIDWIKSLTHTGDAQEALENWAANIELGVRVEHRKKGDDPGEEFDGSFPGGVATPRTMLLQEADLIIQQATSGKDVPWKKVAALLRQTQIEHGQLTKKEGLNENEFTTPHLGQWKNTSEGYVRDKPSGSYEPGGSEEKKEKSGRPMPQVQVEKGVSEEIAQTVVKFLQDHNYNPGGPLLIVTGKNWACYIRCVLHKLGKIDRYEVVMKRIEGARINIGSGVTVGSEEELAVMAVITEVTGQQFYVEAIDAQHDHPAYSQNKEGVMVRILLTGAHFSLRL